MTKTTSLLVLILLYQSAYCQYTVNGNATRDNCHCYTLTTNNPTQSGSVWNNNRIDLSQSFNFTFDVFLGCNDGGADGLAFVLQPISTSVGGNGSGMGYGGISPGVGVTLDTYQNSSPDSDPFYDHIAIQINGNVNHNSANTITPPTPISATSDNVEDCAWHVLKISWDAVAKTLTVSFDGQVRVSANRDLVNTIFGGNSLVFWGFTGATGALTNLQQFCTALTPRFHLLPAQKRCVGEPITFYDSTITFGGILKRYWNFGDGSPVDSVNANPTHIYNTGGNYTVTLTVIAIDSCLETFSQQISVGSKPIANFAATDTCANLQVNFQNTSTVGFGTINGWYWDFDNGNTSILQQPSTVYTTPGIKNVKLVVKTLEGCVSDTVIKPVSAFAKPLVDFSYTDSVCLGTASSFVSNVSVSDGSISVYNWTFPGATITTQNASFTFLTPGNHSVTLNATSNHGCSASLVKTIFISDKPTAHFTFPSVCQFEPTVLTDSSYSGDGFPITNWYWDLGNGQFSTQQNPTVSYTTAGIKTIKLTVRNARGCSSDTTIRTLNIKEKPIANFGFNANVCTGTAVPFFDSSVISSGNIANWSWLQNGSQWSTIQNPVRLLSPGVYAMALVVSSSQGCVSDTVIKTFIVNPRPVIETAFEDECKNTPVFFAGSVSVGAINTWHWNFGDGAIASTMSPAHSYSSNGLYSVSTYGIDIYGCHTDTIIKPINIYGTDAFAGNDTMAAAGQPLQLTASGGNSYAWTPATGLSDAGINNPVATLSSDQTYILKAFTPEGCESFDTITIKIYAGPEIYMPNAFTPNNDGVNDLFRGIPVGLKEFHFMKIYNRWGQEIFASTDYRRGWDGTFKGALQEKGVYVVIIRGRDFRGKEIFRKGTVMLIR